MDNPMKRRSAAIALSVVVSATITDRTGACSLADRINKARFSEIGSIIREDARARENVPDGPSPVIVKAQIALDRAGFSVGVIDGYDGDNMKKAVRAFQNRQGADADGELDEKTWKALESHAHRVVTIYTVTEKDLAEPIGGPIPEDYAKMAEMDRLGYTSVREMIAERFHLDEDLLVYLNPDARFSSAGEEIAVADPGADIEGKTVVRIEVDGAAGRLQAFDSQDSLVATYPATVGSRENPSPSGTHEVRAIAPEPTYSYRPDVNFTQDDNTEPLTLPPGPNGPVGSIWIDLTEPTFGIHGTPEPSKIDKAASHGCVRLANWDAEELARLIERGTVVEFVESGRL
jgi:lipoprotein-anchoring transpeptidase ErfK/SrfK